MTDKQIIIDGVDVSGCLFHSLTTMGYAGYNYCKCFQCICECHRDCYYKQLKAKEQEYERLSSIIRKTQTYKDTCCDCRDEILLYPSISGRTNYTQIEVEERSLERIIQQLSRKEQECEELKKQITILDDETIVVEITEKQFEEYQQLKKALTEIKNVIGDRNKEGEAFCDDRLYKIEQILQKCEVLNE